MKTQRCRCPGRPLTIATWRNSTLQTVIRHHWLPCQLGDEELDRVNWQPLPGAPVRDYNNDQPWWARRRPDQPPEPPEPTVRLKPRTDRRSSYRR